MKTKLKNNQSGFTIIEVMIVLVIAAVILLIVFLAVPALQRNSRNTQRKDDIGRILVATREYQNNNREWTTSETDIINLSGNLAFYRETDFMMAGANGGKAPSQTSLAILNLVKAWTGRTAIIYNQGKCEGERIEPGGSFVALYFVESSSGDIAQCQEG